MGLAASQARFLAITSRKMNCEFQSMQIAQEKLSVTRELQDAAKNYQNSLSASKLVWDSDGKCDGTGEIYNLSYALMMTPSAANEYDPYLITDTQGRIVLDNNMFNAAVSAGVINKNGSPIGRFSMGTANSTNDGSRNAFLYQLGVVNVASSSTVRSIIELGKSGYSAAGIGGEITDKTIAGAMTTNVFKKYLKNAKYVSDTKDTDPKVYQNKEVEFKKGDPMYGLDLTKILGEDLGKSTSFSDADKIIVTKNGKGLTTEEIQKLTLGDLLDDQYVITFTGQFKDASGNGTVGKKVTDVLEAIANLLGTGSSVVKGLNTDSEAAAALSQALEFTKQGYVDKNHRTGIDKVGDGTYKNACATHDAAKKTNNFVYAADKSASVSISNMLKTFLTQFAIALDGFDTNYNVDIKDASKSKYVTDDLSYYFVTRNEYLPAQTPMEADFYNMLYNQLCVNGACTDDTTRDMITDPEYLNHALKNGQLFVSSLNTDGYFYQGHYTASAHIAEVADDDAIAQAEAEYNVKKSKLNYKEQTLELKMKNIDTELSALTTEYDSVKNLISKNVEKVFAMFSS